MNTANTNLQKVNINLPILPPKLIPKAIPLFSRKCILNQSKPNTKNSSPIRK